MRRGRGGKRRGLRPASSLKKSRVVGARAPTEDDLVSVTSSELRNMDLDELLVLMNDMGLEVADIQAKTEALTALMNNAYEVEVA